MSGAGRNVADRIRPLRRVAGRVEAAEVRWFGRSLLSLAFRQPVLVLETTGRTSGKRRRTPLAYAEVAGELVVVGGAGGQTQLPDWVANLRAEPRVTVVLQRREEPRTARELAGDERRAMWPQLLERFPMISRYEAQAGRPIPVVVLEREPTGAASDGG